MNNAKIKNIELRKVYDSRGIETIEIDVFTANNGFGRVAAPFGAPGSKGVFEVKAYANGGVDESIRIIEDIFLPELLGKDVSKIEEIDSIIREKDGTVNFSRIGGNTSSALSIACAKAAANSFNTTLVEFLNKKAKYKMPYPIGNVIGGGGHSSGPCPDMQDHLIIPVGAKSMWEAVSINIEVYHTVGKIITQEVPGFVGGKDDEAAWIANLNDVEALEILQKGAKTVSDIRGVEIRLGLDVAADRLWDEQNQHYKYSREGVVRTTSQQVEHLVNLIKKFNLIYVEDGFESNDYNAFNSLKRLSPHDCLICTDDLTASNEGRLIKSLETDSANTIIIKPNQIGTLTGACRTATLAKDKGYRVCLSHRSGETIDDTIAHLAVAWGSSFIKTGVVGGERLAKLNELIRLEDFLQETSMAKL